MFGLGQRIRPGLVLGGGGARGGAHVGVLQILNEVGYNPEIVVGTSIGGLVAATYAAGWTIEQMQQAMCEARARIMDCSRNDGRGRTRTERLRNALEDSFGDADLRDLNPEVAVMATDLREGRRILIRQGSAVKALLASMAITGVFSPVEWDSYLLADGGILDNLPTQAAYQLGADRIVAVDIRGDSRGAHTMLSNLRSINKRYTQMLEWMLKFSRRQDVFEICVQSMAITSEKLGEVYLRAFPPDVLIRPELSEVELLSMKKVPKAVAAGAHAARAAQPQVEKLMRYRNGGRKAILRHFPAVAVL